MAQPNAARIVPLEADAMANIEMAFLSKRFLILPRGGWKEPPREILRHYTGMVWRENVGNFNVGKRFIRAGGFAGKADWCGIVAPVPGASLREPIGRWLFFEAKKDSKTKPSPMQACMAEWMSAYGAMTAVVWDYQSTIDALASYGY